MAPSRTFLSCCNAFSTSPLSIPLNAGKRPINPTESITLKAGAAVPVTPGKLPFKPYYSRPNSSDNNYYRLFVTDFSKDYSGPVPSPHHYPYLTKDATDENFTAAVVRVWASGKLVTSVKIGDSSAGCDNTHDLWKVLEVKGDGSLVSKNTCAELGSDWYFTYD